MKPVIITPFKTAPLHGTGLDFSEETINNLNEMQVEDEDDEVWEPYEEEDL